MIIIIITMTLNSSMRRARACALRNDSACGWGRVIHWRGILHWCTRLRKEERLKRPSRFSLIIIMALKRINKVSLKYKYAQ